MVIIEDSRQQIGQHANVHDYCAKNNIQIVRSKLLVGDYSLPTDQSVVVDTKFGLAEVYGNLVQDHERFKKECVLAQELGIRLVVLVEEGWITCIEEVQKWKNPRFESYYYLKNAQAHGKFTNKSIPKKPPISSQRLMNMMIAMQSRYGVEWRFCDKRSTGAVIVEVLTNGK